MVYELK